MEFEKSSLYRVMEFENFIEVGNLSWAGRALAKTGQKPITDPPREKNFHIFFVLLSRERVYNTRNGSKGRKATQRRKVER